MEYRPEEAQKLIDTKVLVFACPSCRRRPRWRRDNLDRLCDAATDINGAPEGHEPVLDLSRCE